MTGESVNAAKSVGIKTNRIKFLCLMISAATCALAGLNLSVEQLGMYTINMTANRGFICLSAINCGRKDPEKACVYALIFGFVRALQTIINRDRFCNIDHGHFVAARHYALCHDHCRAADRRDAQCPQKSSALLQGSLTGGISMPKTAVLVIDMQKDFTRPEGRFYYPETTGEMMKTFPEKLNKMRDLGALVVIVYTAHPADEKEVNPELTRMFRDGKKASLVEGSAGAELEERIPYDPERDIMFRKFVPSAFFGTNLAEILRERGVENVLVCGVKTNVCCRATATDASAYRFRTYMISDMLGTNTKEINDFHLAEMTKYFAKAISSDEVCERLKNGVF